MKTILITGGTTFVSKYVAKHFADKRDRVYVINRNSRNQIDGVTLIDCDRTKLTNQLKNIHFDAVLDITAYTEEHIKTLLGSLYSFDDYIFISSSAVYPETNPQPFTEEQACGKNSVWGEYGINKLRAEKHLIKNVPNAYILRPPYFYGIYENLYREPFVFDCALENRAFYLPDKGNMKLQFFNVSDLCRFIEILIEKHPENRIFNLGNKEIVTVKEWVAMCYELAGKKPEFVNVSKSVNQRDYFCFYDHEYILDTSKQYKLMSETTPLKDGLKEEFKWYKNHRNEVNKKPYFEFIDKNLYWMNKRVPRTHSMP